MKQLILWLIKQYRKINLVHVCRFTPTCSEYTYQTVEKYGAIKGTYLGVRRVLRCHPWNSGGYDPVN